MFIIKKHTPVYCLLILFIVFSLLSGCGTNASEPENNDSSRNEQVESNAPAGSPVTVKFATLDVGTGYYSYGGLFAELMRKELPAGSVVDVLPYGGTVGSLDLVARGDAQIGLTSPFVLKWAEDGVLAFEGKPYNNLRMLVTGLDSYFFAAYARKDVNINSLKDIKDGRLKLSLATGQPRSLGHYGGGLILEAYGLSYDMLKEFGGQVTHTSSDVISDNVKDGKIDVVLEYFNLGHPSVTDVATLTPIKFLHIEPEISKYLQENYGFQPALLPAGSFPGQDEDVELVGGPTTVFCREDLPDEVAYALTKSIVDNYEYLQQNLGAFKDFTPDKAASTASGLPFHPGAEKYYKEKGLL